MTTCTATRTSDHGHRLQGPCTLPNGHTGRHESPHGWCTETQSSYQSCRPDFECVHPTGHDGPHHNLA